jgi:threonine dehydratase/serine racemase
MLTIADVRAAAERIRPVVHRTPVFTSDTLDRLSGRSLHFKCELFQKTGSFKYRGASNAVRKLDDATAAKGVITHSSGNHGQALALAAKVRGIPATIVMPASASPVKKAAILGYGASVVESGPSLTDREEKVAEMREKSGATMIPPFDHPDVIAGQGTAALELLEEVPDLDAIVSPIGGGGLISGFTLAAKGFNSKCRVFGAEPTGASAAAQSKTAGDRVKLDSTKSIADGLLANYVGTLTWPFIRDQVETVFTVSEEQIIAAMRLVWERMKLVIEPSAAVGVAVVLSDPFKALTGLSKVGIVLCGGNVSLDKLYW